MMWVIGGEAIGIDGSVPGFYHGQIPLTITAPSGPWTVVVPINFTVAWGILDRDEFLITPAPAGLTEKLGPLPFYQLARQIADNRR